GPGGRASGTGGGSCSGTRRRSPSGTGASTSWPPSTATPTSPSSRRRWPRRRAASAPAGGRAPGTPPWPRGAGPPGAPPASVGSRHHRVMEARMADFVDPHRPPRLPGLLVRAGLTVSQAAVIPVLERRYDPDAFSVGVIDITRDTAIRQGIPKAEAEAWAADLRGRTADGDYFF